MAQWSGDDWYALFTGLSTLVGAVTGAYLTFLRMRPDYERGRSLRPRPREEDDDG